jgi:hypothetical protein
MATSGNPVRTHESPPEGYDSKESAGEVAQSERAGGVQLVDGPEVQLSERETLEDAAESERGAPQQPEPADSGIEIAQVDVTDLPGLDNIDVDRYVGLARQVRRPCSTHTAGRPDTSHRGGPRGRDLCEVAHRRARP